MINGVRIDSPVAFVGREDTVTFFGEEVGQASKTNARAYRVPHLWIYHKPVGEITTHHDPQNRPTVFQSAQRLGLPRVVSVGRLDLNSEGLLLLTDNSTLLTLLEHPSTQYRRVYRVRLFGCPSKQTFQRWACHSSKNKGQNGQTFAVPSLTLAGVHYAPFTITFEKPLCPLSSPLPKPYNFWASLILTEGKNREIRKIMEAFGLQVNRLIRLSYGPFVLGNLQSGQVRRVPLPKELLKQIEQTPLFKN